MKSLTLFIVVLFALPIFGQGPPMPQLMVGKVSGMVLDRDGVTPLQNVDVQVEQLVSRGGQIQVRERVTTKTGSDGRYSFSGLYIGRVRVSIIVNKQTVMTKGDRLGEEIFLANDVVARVNFDLSKATKAKD